jgi:hypothetical protein
MDEGTTMKSVKVVTATAVLTAASAVLAPSAQADMPWGDYEVLTNRYTDASWVWFTYPCRSTAPDCKHISGIPRPQFGMYYGGDAHLVNGQWVLNMDVPDGLRCLGRYSMPTHETWTWDANTLTGTIDSRYDVGCWDGPPGSQFWTFALQRM